MSYEFGLVAEDGKTRIRDGRTYFPNSFIRYTHFTQYDVRTMFAYLRQKEEIHQQEISSRQGIEKGIAIVRLQMVEGMLAFMAANFRYVIEESEPDNDWGEGATARLRDRGGSEYTGRGCNG